MNELKELINIYLSRRMGQIETFRPEDENHKSLLYKLFEDIRSNSFNTDDEARNLLYGDKEASQGSKFNMLKKRLKEKLYNTMLFLKPLNEKANGYVENIFYCNKYYVIARQLISIGANNSGYGLLKKVLERALLYEQHEIALISTSVFRQRALYNGSRAELTYYNRLFKQTIEVINAETETEEAHFNVLIEFSDSIAHRPHLLPMLEETVGNIFAHCKKHCTYKLKFYHFYSQVVLHQLKQEYQQAMAACHDFEAYLLGNERQYSVTRHAHTLLLMMDCARYEQDYESSKHCFEKTTAIYRPDNINWFISHELYFILLLNMEKYEEAAVVLQNVHQNKTFKVLPAQYAEKWEIFSAYTWLLLTLKNETALRETIFSGLRSFDINKFLKKIPVYTKDKTGYNISVLILQVLILYTRDKFAAALNSSEKLKHYLHKYLKRDGTYRSQVFIKMLNLLVTRRLDESAMAEAETLLKKMEKERMSFTITEYSIEVIPYERLWKMVIEKIRL